MSFKKIDNKVEEFFKFLNGKDVNEIKQNFLSTLDELMKIIENIKMEKPIIDNIKARVMMDFYGETAEKLGIDPMVFITMFGEERNKEFHNILKSRLV